MEGRATCVDISPNQEQSDQQVAASEVWTLQDVAYYLGLGHDHRDPISAVRYLCRARKLKFVKVGKTLRFRKKWVDEFLEREATLPL